VARPSARATNATRAALCALPPPAAMSGRNHPILYGVSPSLVALGPGIGRATHIYVANGRPLCPTGPPAASSRGTSLPPVWHRCMSGWQHDGGSTRKKMLGAVINGRSAGPSRVVISNPGWKRPWTLPFLAPPTFLRRWRYAAMAGSFSAHVPGRSSRRIRYGRIRRPRAGAFPSVVVPFAADQFFWAERFASARRCRRGAARRTREPPRRWTRGIAFAESSSARLQRVPRSGPGWQRKMGSMRRLLPSRRSLSRQP